MKDLTPCLSVPCMAMHKNHPFSVGNPEDIASIAVSVAVEDSHMLTGTTIAAEGGYSRYLKVVSDVG